MTLRLTPETLAAAYDYLATTPPFDRWNMPPSDDVLFRVAKTPAYHGWSTFKDGKHEIVLSRGGVGHTTSVLATMAHEMIHVHERQTRMHTAGPEHYHSAAFKKLAKQVCRHHGFDPATFL